MPRKWNDLNLLFFFFLGYWVFCLHEMSGKGALVDLCLLVILCGCHSMLVVPEMFLIYGGSATIFLACVGCILIVGVAGTF